MRSIIWADMRAQEQAEKLREKIDDETFYQITGHRNTASYGIQKAMWLKDRCPEIYEKTYRLLQRLKNRFWMKKDASETDE